MEAYYQTNLSINDYFFDEILVNIFTYFNGGQLRICREICSKWNDLLKAEKFKAQWQCLYITHHIGLNDIIYLMNSDWKFKKLVFRDMMWKSFPESVMNDFLNFLTKTVEEIEIDLDDFNNLLQFFPSLQILRIKLNL
uniref:CSON009277 protein n=1 Tax=Culicoides sonorensis TaxID=179676 RepID=A0A336N2W7_CULSO